MRRDTEVSSQRTSYAMGRRRCVKAARMGRTRTRDRTQGNRQKYISDDTVCAAALGLAKRHNKGSRRRPRAVQALCFWHPSKHPNSCVVCTVKP
eukprot:1155026-Pelagomonas_calceolata.AAC.1